MYKFVKSCQVFCHNLASLYLHIVKLMKRKWRGPDCGAGIGLGPGLLPSVAKAINPQEVRINQN